MTHHIAQACLEELCSDSSTYGVGVTLTERTRRVFDTVYEVYFGVTRCGATPLTELLQIFESILTCQCQLGVEHRRHVSGIQIEAVATLPEGVIGVVLEKLAIEYVDKVSTAHSTTRVTRLRFFYHRCSQNSDIVRCSVH